MITITIDTNHVGTSFQEIYCISNITSKKIDNLPTNLKYKLLSNYMKQSIGMFESDCYKDISKYNGFNQFEYTYVSDGIETELELLPRPSENMLIYIGTRSTQDESYTEIVNYTYDKENGKIILENAAKDKSEIYVAFFNIGHFYVDLNQTEQNILACGIECAFDDAERQKDSLLTQRVYSSNTKIHSQANHIQVLNELHDSMYFKKLQSMINKYTFKHSLDKMYGLTGEVQSNDYIGWW